MTSVESLDSGCTSIYVCLKNVLFISLKCLKAINKYLYSLSNEILCFHFQVKPPKIVRSLLKRVHTLGSQRCCFGKNVSFIKAIQLLQSCIIKTSENFSIDERMQRNLEFLILIFACEVKLSLVILKHTLFILILTRD